MYRLFPCLSAILTIILAVGANAIVETDKDAAAPEVKLLDNIIPTETAPATAKPFAKPVPEAASAILVDAETGQVLYTKNAAIKRPMASTTKIMTAALALENGKLDDVIVVPKGVENIPESSFHLVPGEKMTLQNLLYALMVRSANDAAVVIGRHIGGSDAKFVQMMNKRAAELGMKNTRFKNPNGLHAEGHYSTAYDLSILARHAVGLPMFNELCNTRSIVISRTASKDQLLKAKHRYILKYPLADGIKSGYTRQARYCYVGSATLDRWRLIGVVLRSEHSADDMMAMMNYGFTAFERKTLIAAGQHAASMRLQGAYPETVNLQTNAQMTLCLPRNLKRLEMKPEVGYVSLPLNKGDVVGTLVASVDGKAVRRIELSSTEDVRPASDFRLAFLAIAGGVPTAYAIFRRLGDNKTGRRQLDHAH